MLSKPSGDGHLTSVGLAVCARNPHDCQRARVACTPALLYMVFNHSGARRMNGYFCARQLSVTAAVWFVTIQSQLHRTLCWYHAVQEAVEYMQQEHGVDLAAVLGQCISEYSRSILYRGGPLTWCPAGPAPSRPGGGGGSASGGTAMYAL